MNGKPEKYISPAVNKLAFNCPHCGALAKQFWFNAYAWALDKDEWPDIKGNQWLLDIDFSNIDDEEEREREFLWSRRMVSGMPFFDIDDARCTDAVRNLHISRCFNCNEVGIWLYDRLLWPQRGEVPLPNRDLPEEIQRDYDEAGAILDLSPRGAAALLRLAIQKLCKELGGKGKRIDEDIAALVKKGLDVRVQQALDVVRVIGNKAVHPGQVDLRDDRATAEKLFGLVNLIAEIMISQPKHVQEMFAGLPEEARTAIQKRDGAP